MKRIAVLVIAVTVLLIGSITVAYAADGSAPSVYGDADDGVPTREDVVCDGVCDGTGPMNGNGACDGTGPMNRGGTDGACDGTGPMYRRAGNGACDGTGPRGGGNGACNGARGAGGA